MSLPDILPILSGGGHESRTDGACIMEYASVLAGEKFSDFPMCVDTQLAITMQFFNDELTDEERSVLVPFIGRSIGLVVPNRPTMVPRNFWWKEYLTAEYQVSSLHESGLEWPHYVANVVRLRTLVHQKVAAKLHLRKGRPQLQTTFRGPVTTTWRKIDPAEELSMWLGHSISTWWNGLKNIRTPRARQRYVDKVVRYVTALHEAYEEAMDELGWERPHETAPEAIEQVTQLVPTS